MVSLRNFLIIFSLHNWSIHTIRCIVVLYWVYCWKIIQQRMLVVDRLIHIFFFHIFFKSCIGFMLSNCVNKKMCACFHMFFKSSVDFGFKSQTNGMWNTQYSIELNVHKQPSVFKTTYTVQCRVNCPNVCKSEKKIFIIFFLLINYTVSVLYLLYCTANIRYNHLVVQDFGKNFINE